MVEKKDENITFVELENYRCFGENSKIGPFGRFNLIFGSNGSGKTSFLESIELAILRHTSRLRGKACEDIKEIIKSYIPGNNDPTIPSIVVLNKEEIELFSFPQEDTERKKAFKSLQLFERYGVKENGTNETEKLRDILDRILFLNFETVVNFLEARNSEKLLTTLLETMFGYDIEMKWTAFEQAKDICMRTYYQNIVKSDDFEYGLDTVLEKYMALSYKKKELHDNILKLFLQEQTASDDDLSVNEKLDYYDEISALLDLYPSESNKSQVKNELKEVQKKIQEIKESTAGNTSELYSLERIKSLSRETLKQYAETEKRVRELLHKLKDTLINPDNEHAAEMLNFRKKALKKSWGKPKNKDGTDTRSLNESIEQYIAKYIEVINDHNQTTTDLAPYWDASQREKMSDVLDELAKLYNSKKITVDNSLKQMMQDFEKTVSTIFAALCNPPDFDKIEILGGSAKGDGQTTVEEITTRWKNDDKKEPAAHVMSAGQRSTLAIATIFTLNIQYPDGLPYLILDEPLHNLDQLTLLSCLDLLRGFIERYPEKQIFLSTADRRVEGLARHKFNYLGKDFKHFKCSRIPGKSTEVTPQP